MRKFWLSCYVMTIKVVTDDDFVIVDIAPILEKFLGQHISKLHKWLASFGNFSWAEI